MIGRDIRDQGAEFVDPEVFSEYVALVVDQAREDAPAAGLDGAVHHAVVGGRHRVPGPDLDPAPADPHPAGMGRPHRLRRAAVGPAAGLRHRDAGRRPAGGGRARHRPGAGHVRPGQHR